MPAYYDAQAVLPGIQWSKTVYPRVLRHPQLWLCLAVHGTLVVLLREGHLELPAEHGALVPAELVAPLLLLALLGMGMLTASCQRWHQAVTDACARVGEQTRLFVQELQTTFGRADEVLALRFAAAKYALAGVYLFFFAVTGGAVTARAWGELRAKGLLDDREVQFLEGQYAGDRIALLHVWATWAAQEAAATPTVREQLGGPAALAGSLGRLAEALQGAAAAAREAAGLVAAPVPHHQLQLTGLATTAALLALAAAAAPAAAREEPRYAASAAYAAVLIAMLGLREAAKLLLDPLREGHGFPVAATVNATADAVAQLLAASTPAAFDPRPAWRDASHTLFSQGQIERRTPGAAFAAGRGNPYHWQEAKPAVAGDQAPPPLLDVGCCHLDVEALPKVGGGKHPSKLVLSRRQRQDGAGALIARLRDTGSSQGAPASALSEAGSDARPCASSGSPATDPGPRASTAPPSSCGRSSELSLAASPQQELSLAASPGMGHPSLAGASRAYRGQRRGSGAGRGAGEGEATWARASEEPRARGAGSSRVSPGELGPSPPRPAAAPAARRQLQL